MMKLAQLGILLALFFAIKPTQAALLIEPLVGYNINTKAELEPATGSDISTTGGKGTSYGGRLGYQQLGFQIGLDYLHSSMDLNKSSVKSDLVSDEFGGFIGFEFPILLRVYAGYIFSATAEADIDNGSGEQKWEFSKGSGTKLGLGITTLPFLDINIEYRRVGFSEYEAGGTDYEKDSSYSTLMLGVSLPFNL